MQVSDLGDTVINKFKHGTFRLADFTVLPKHGVWRDILDKHPIILGWLESRKQRRDARQRLEEGFQIGPEPQPVVPAPTIEELAKDEPTNEELAKKLPKMVRQIADDMKGDPSKRYTYEEWVEFTQLIRFTSAGGDTENRVDLEGLIEWDWIGEDSPMMSKSSEAEFVLDRLCESMQRYVRSAIDSVPDPAPNGKSSPALHRNASDPDVRRKDRDGSPGDIRRSGEISSASESSGS